MTASQQRTKSILEKFLRSIGSGFNAAGEDRLELVVGNRRWGSSFDVPAKADRELAQSFEQPKKKGPNF